MTTRHLVDPELVALLDTFPALNLTAESLPQTRNFFKEMTKSQTLVDPPEFSMISVSERSIPGPQGAPDVRDAAAARADHLEGLPPTFISVGSLDLFLEEDLEYARRLLWAGVPTELHIYPGAFHAFDSVEGAKITQAFVHDQLDALKRAFS